MFPNQIVVESRIPLQAGSDGAPRHCGALPAHRILPFDGLDGFTRHFTGWERMVSSIVIISQIIFV
jgi:hypothetical protein